jgi:hypothetical protein
MSKFRSRTPTTAITRGRGGRVGNVPIIEIAERRHNVRIAKITFWVVALVGWPTIAVIAYGVLGPSGTGHKILAGFIGFLTALALACVTSLIVLVWPIVRVLWHWAAEISVGAVLLAGYLALVQVVTYPLAFAILAASVAAPLVLPFTRTAVWPWIWCAIWRHRLRLAFDAFVQSNRYGNVPFILLARPTPAGGRIWVWLRPGLALADLEQRRDKLAVACWAKDIQLAPASVRHAALVQVNVTARDPLTLKVQSPLLRFIPLRHNTSAVPVSPAVVPTALDLPDVPEDDFTTNTDGADTLAVEPKRLKPVRNTSPATTASTGSATGPAAGPGVADDIADWL